MDYYYLAFGLTMKSDIEIEEFVEIEKCNELDVEIKLGKVPESLEHNLEEPFWYYAKENELVFTVADIAKYYVHNGNEIIIEPLVDAENSAIRVYLLGTAFGAILFQRGRVPFHGSALSINNIGVIITGESGAGKSTVTNALIKKGYNMVTDDVAALEIDEENKLKIYPSYPRQKLWIDSVRHMQIDISEIRRMDGTNDKFYLPVEEFCYHPIELKAIFELKPMICKQVSVEELIGKERLEVILNNTYRSVFIEPLGLMKNHFFQCVKMTKMLKVYRLCRPENEFTIDEQVNSIESVLNY
ncbi:MAG: hypothetical protein CVU84_11225 [Firmicutes bacterium HGW-Firmicutes-1]|nr:MAG: hypothetical protein CVU84_11225 [Firmicutes bacterium HGW-Firmicutes-1]